MMKTIRIRLYYYLASWSFSLALRYPRQGWISQFCTVVTRQLIRS